MLISKNVAQYFHFKWYFNSENLVQFVNFIIYYLSLATLKLQLCADFFLE